MKQFLLYFLVGLWTFPTFLKAQSSQFRSERVLLGIHSDPISKDKAQKLGFKNLYGRYVTGVLQNTAAEKIGIQPLDYVVAINDEALASDKCLSAILCKYQPQDKIRVQYIRKGVLKTEETVLGTCKEAKDASHTAKAFLGVEHCENPTDLNGVRVMIRDHSTASDLLLRDGDIITRINGYRILDWADLKIVITNMTPGELVTVECLRGDRRIVSSGIMNSYRQTVHRQKHQWHNHVQLDPEGVAYEQYLDEALDAITQQNAPLVLKEEMEPYQVPEVRLLDMTQEEASADLNLLYTNNLEVDKLNFFPHHDRGIFELTFILADKGDTSARILDGGGEEVYRYDLQNFEGTFKDQVDLSNTPQGIYYLELSQNGKAFNKKIVLQ